MNNYKVREIPIEVNGYWEYFLTKVDLNNHNTLIVINDLQKYAARFDKHEAQYLSMSRLGINDWVGPNIGFPEEHLIITEGITTEKDRYLKELDNRQKWIFKLSFAQCYEEFETFWKNSLHFYLSSYTPKGHESLYKNKNVTRDKLRTTDDSFVDGLKFINKPLFVICNHNFDIRQIFRALSLARHKIIHNFGEISKEEMITNVWIEKFFVIERNQGDAWKIDMPKIQYTHALKKLLELGFMFRSFFKYCEIEDTP